MEKKLRLIRPDKRFKEQYLDLIAEWKNSGDSFIPWNLTLDPTDFEGHIDRLDAFSRGEDLEEGFVPSSAYWLVDEEERILGSIDIRHALNDQLRFRGGHIGYGIRPSERRKGLAGVMLSLALDICRQMGISHVLITCSKENKGSVKTILKNGGVLESEDWDPHQHEIFQRYFITLK